MVWLPVQLIDISISDYIRATTGTYAQKWLREGYEDYNATKEGVVVSCGNRMSPDDIKIKQADGRIVPAALNPGSSGYYYFERLHPDSAPIPVPGREKTK